MCATDKFHLHIIYQEFIGGAVVAIYHLHVAIVSRKTRRSAVATSAYHSAEKLHSDHDGITHDYEKSSVVNTSAYNSGERLEHEGMDFDYTRKKGVVHTEIILPHNAPSEYFDRSTLWNAVEKAEKRKDAQTARDIDIALPVELNRQEQIDLVRDYVQENFVDKGMCADFAIHDTGNGNPHAHILLTTRSVGEDGFHKKNRAWNDRACLQSWRENWAVSCNESLRTKGLDNRIDHRTLKAQGIDREPTIHIGVTDKALEKKGIITKRVQKNREIIERNKRKELAKIQKTKRLDKRTDRQMLEKPTIEKPIEPIKTKPSKIHNQPQENYNKIAENLQQLKEKHYIFDKEIMELQEVGSVARRDMNTARITAEEIGGHAEQIRSMKNRVYELQTERQNMSVFKSKKDIDRQIQQAEKSYEQATSYFRKTYKIEPEQARGEITRLESVAQSKQIFQNRINEKLTPLIEEQNKTVYEYQRQRLIVEIHPDKQKIQARLSELEKEGKPYKQSAQYTVLRERSQRLLDSVSERNFERILQELPQQQQKALIELREREREIERLRNITRGRGR
jgi:hypothetical protein